MWLVYLVALLASALLAQTAWELFEGTERTIMVGANVLIAAVWAVLMVNDIWHLIPVL